MTEKVEVIELNKEAEIEPASKLSLKDKISIFTGILYCVLTTGIITGFIPLESMLVSEGVYHNLCPSSEGESLPKTCEDQVLRLELMYALAGSALNASCLLSGLFLDRFGMRWTIFVGGCLMTLGSILFALGSPSFDSYIPGYMLIGFGGMSVQMSYFRMAEMLKKHGGLFISAVSNAFYMSAFVFFVFKLIYDRWGLSVLTLFMVYAIIPAIVTISSFFLVPKESEIKDRRPTHASLIIRTSFRRQIIDKRFLTMVGVISLVLLRQEFYISSYPSRIRWLSKNDESTVNLATLLFSVLFPGLSIVYTPIIGVILDRLALIWCFLMASFVGLLFDIFAMIPVLWAQYVASVCLSLWHALTYSFLPAYYMDCFGYRHFGKLFGITFFTAAIVNLTQYGFNYVIQKSLQGNIFIIDYALISIGIITLVYCAILFYWRRQEAIKSPQDASEENP
jgi:MFS family permease